MTRHEAVKLCREELDKRGLNRWHVRLTTDTKMSFLGLCSYRDECIILSAHHIDIHPDPEIINTIRHEVAHALTPNHNHDEVWAAMARQIGCTTISPCSSLSFSPEIIDAIRSGADVKVEFETETYTVHKPKYTITRLQDKCEVCGKVAKSVRETIIKINDETKPDQKMIILECGHLLMKFMPKGTPFQTLVSNWWREEIKNCKHEWDHNQCTKCAEYKPYPFQVEGARFLEQALAANNGGAILDEMGLGKTVQVLDYLRFSDAAFPVLFIVKSGIKYQWVKEVVRWLGPTHVPQPIELSSDIVIPGLKSYVISYDLLVPKVRQVRGKTVTQGFDLEKFKNSGIKTIVLDECQQIKNQDSTRTQQVRKLIKLLGAKVIPLSGTPWKNRGSEFFTILNLLNPTRFYSFQHFKNMHVEYYEDGNGKTKEGGIRNPVKFRESIKDIAIRREVTEVANQMPNVTRSMRFTELDMVNQRLYDDRESEFVKWYNDKIIGGEDPFAAFESDNILAKLQKMRHLTGLSKIPATIDLAKEFFNETNRTKLTIFVHHIDVGRIITMELKKDLDDKDGELPKEIKVFELTADLNSLERFHLQEEFAKTEYAILVASTGAAGEGINLQTCGDAILHERQWNPANEDQAAPGRFRRIGSTHKLVNVLFQTASGTVDEILGNIVERKRVAFHNAMNKGELPQWNQTDILKELAEGIVKSFNSKNKSKRTGTK